MALALLLSGACAAAAAGAPVGWERMIWVCGALFALTIAALGLACLLLAPELAAGTPLARAVCGFLGVFWGVRLAVGWFLFDVRSYLAGPWSRLGYQVLNGTFLYLMLVGAWGALRAPGA